ncbi:MAG TPA: helix-turn-helix domain-containing protein [Sphingomicrobium sp.]|nr:helix-turn-helix domain-containing protein [Sphingomicrobium sp.]
MSIEAKVAPYGARTAISDQQDKVFRALASHHRRAILDVLRDQPLTTGALCAQFPELDRCTVMQHLKVLESADLIIVERRGRERWNHLNTLPIHAIHERWIGPHAESAVALLAKLKRDLETSLIH